MTPFGNISQETTGLGEGKGTHFNAKNGELGTRPCNFGLLKWGDGKGAGCGNVMEDELKRRKSQVYGDRIQLKPRWIL